MSNGYRDSFGTLPLHSHIFREDGKSSVIGIPKDDKYDVNGAEWEVVQGRFSDTRADKDLLLTPARVYGAVTQVRGWIKSIFCKGRDKFDEKVFCSGSGEKHIYLRQPSKAILSLVIY